MDALKLVVDSRKRISLTRLLPEGKTSSVRAYRENDQITLEPTVEIPAREARLHANKGALEKVRRGLSQKGKVKRGSFAKQGK